MPSKRNIGVFLPNWLGDAVMATPAIRLLYERLGNEYELYALGRPVVLELFDGNPWFTGTIPLQARKPEPGHSFWDVVRTLRKKRLEHALLFPNSVRSALTAWCGRIKYRIGYAKEGRGMFLTTALKVPDGEIPLTDYYLKLTEPFTEQTVENDVNTYRLELFTTPEEEQLGEQIWRNLGLREDVLTLNVGSANSAARNWSEDYAVRFAQRVVDELNFDVLLNCGPGETELAERIVQRSQRDRVFSLAKQPLNIHSGKICLKRSRILVSTDSGPLHIAAAFGVPTVCLLGPTSETYIANPSVQRLTLSRRLPCAPCFAKQNCPEHHHRCMSELTPEWVFEQTKQLLMNHERQ